MARRTRLFAHRSTDSCGSPPTCLAQPYRMSHTTNLPQSRWRLVSTLALSLVCVVHRLRYSDASAVDWADFPIVDLSKASTVEGRVGLAPIVRDAMQTYGFMYIIHHGLSQSQAGVLRHLLGHRVMLIHVQNDRMVDIADVPFTQVSEAEKQQYASKIKETGSYRGFKPREFWVRLSPSTFLWGDRSDMSLETRNRRSTTACATRLRTTTSTTRYSANSTRKRCSPSSRRCVRLLSTITTMSCILSCGQCPL